MAWLVRMLFGIQVLCSCFAAPAGQGAGAALLSPRCDDAAVEEAADLALRQINADREEGYVLSLYRIVSAREQPQEITGSVFYLILDVVDTECHVLSKKLWKDCKTRPAHSTVRILCFYLIPHIISYSGTTDGKIPTTCIFSGQQSLGKIQAHFIISTVLLGIF
uniref:Cystatin fetuin-B-type domain-containing protein n=1 Tax=Ficedula albicollis TaxID=59894 RepID=A0A803WAD1_FICAL